MKKETVKKIFTFIEYIDLALIKVAGKIPGKRVIKGIAFPEIAEKVYTVGSHLSRFFVYGEGVYSGISTIGDIYMLPTMGGCSGSGVFNKEGKLMGLIFESNYSYFGIFPTMDVAHGLAIKTVFIKNFLRGFVEVD